MGDSSNHGSLEGDKKPSAPVNEALRLASDSAQTDGALMGRVRDGVELLSSKGGSEGRTERIIDILQPTAVKLPEGDHSNNLHHPPLLEYLHWLKDSLLLRLMTGAAAETAMSRDRRPEGSSVVVDDDSPRINQDLEIGIVTEEAIERKVHAGTSSGYQHQDNDNRPDCRICQMSTTTDDVIDLGCACKLDMGRVHGVCAVTWFRFRGSRQCEICGEIAKNVYIPEEIMDKGALNIQDTVIPDSIGHHVDCESCVASTGQVLYTYRKHIFWMVFMAVFVTACLLYSFKHIRGR